MSANFNSTRQTPGEANDEMMGVRFIDLEEISDEQEVDEQAIKEREKLRRRLHQAKSSHRLKRELYDCMYKEILEHDRLINEETAKKKNHINKLKQLQQQVANIRRSEEADEQVLHQKLLSEEKLYIREKRKEIQTLQEKKKHLSAELDTLKKEKKYQDEIQKLRDAEQKLKHKLEAILEILHSKDNETEEKLMTVIQKQKEIEEYMNTINALRQDQRKLSITQEKQILSALNVQEKSKTLCEQTPSYSEMHEKDEEHKYEKPLKTGSWWRRCARNLWKGVNIAANISLGLILSVGIVATVMPDCYSLDIDYNLGYLPHLFLTVFDLQ